MAAPATGFVVVVIQIGNLEGFNRQEPETTTTVAAAQQRRDPVVETIVTIFGLDNALRLSLPNAQERELQLQLSDVVTMMVLLRLHEGQLEQQQQPQIRNSGVNHQELHPLPDLQLTTGENIWDGVPLEDRDLGPLPEPEPEATTGEINRNQLDEPSPGNGTTIVENGTGGADGDLVHGISWEEFIRDAPMDMILNEMLRCEEAQNQVGNFEVGSSSRVNNQEYETTNTQQAISGNIHYHTNQLDQSSPGNETAVVENRAGELDHGAREEAIREQPLEEEEEAIQENAKKARFDKS